MLYRCHECDATFESHHTNYKHAKGYHPSVNPDHKKDVASTEDHCSNCQSLRSYDAVDARKRDMTMAAPNDSPRTLELLETVQQLGAQVEALKASKMKEQSLEAMVSDLQSMIGKLRPATAVAA